MRRYYYFGCRGSESGHYIHGEGGRHIDTLAGGFPTRLLDDVFTPLDRNDRRWRLTHLRFGGHVISILACHDNTIDKRPGSNANFVVVDAGPWTGAQILEMAREIFPDCAERLREVLLPEGEGA